MSRQAYSSLRAVSAAEKSRQLSVVIILYVVRFHSKKTPGLEGVEIARHQDVAGESSTREHDFSAHTTTPRSLVELHVDTVNIALDVAIVNTPQLWRLK